MSARDLDVHDHDHAPRALGPRRDPLGLAALLGDDAGLVPISDLDAGAAWPSACATAESTPARAPTPSACGACTTRCATAELVLGGAPTRSPEQTP